MTVRCHFYLLNRIDRADSTALYVGGQGYLLTDHPPIIGDLAYLSGHTPDPGDPEGPALGAGGAYRVVDRAWAPAAYGSQSWSYGERQTEPERLDVMLEPAGGLFEPAES